MEEVFPLGALSTDKAALGGLRSLVIPAGVAEYSVVYMTASAVELPKM